MLFDFLAHVSNCVIFIEILGHNAVTPDVEIKVMIVPDKESQTVDFFVAISKKVIFARLDLLKKLSVVANFSEAFKVTLVDDLV